MVSINFINWVTVGVMSVVFMLAAGGLFNWLGWKVPGITA